MFLVRRRSANNEKSENKGAVSHRLDINMDSIAAQHVALDHCAMFERNLLAGRTILLTGGGTGLDCLTALAGRAWAPSFSSLAAIENRHLHA